MVENVFVALSRGKLSAACRVLDERSSGSAATWGTEAARVLNDATASIHASTQTASAHCCVDPARRCGSEPRAVRLRSICGKQYASGMYCYHCRDCESDRTCAICVECFEEARHVGHEYRLVRAGGGVCDCGDEVCFRQFFLKNFVILVFFF
jgi:hypothetical protein